MSSQERQYWIKKLGGYAEEEWSKQPSLFAQFAINYFPNEGKVLELGAGVGQDSIWFATKGYEVIQSDMIDTGFEYTRQVANQKGLNLGQTLVDLSNDLPFENESFDVIYAHLSLHYFDKGQTQKIFDEIFRVLKTGGILAALFNPITDPDYGKGEKIDNDLFLLDGIYKRYFSVETATEFSRKFKIVVADSEGETYKDRAKGIMGQIRLIGKKLQR